MQALSVSDKQAGVAAASAAARKNALDVRARMAVSVLASLVTIGIASPEGQLVLFAGSLAYALSARRGRAIALAYAVMALMAGLASLCTWAISLLSPAMPFQPRGLAVPFLRGAVMMNVVLPLALTCRIQEMLSALKNLKLPFCIYIPAAVMIRFIPTFMNDIRQVAETLKIRGYRLCFGEMLRHPLMLLRLMFTPLLFRSLRTSEELGMAAELKGLEAKSRFVPMCGRPWTRNDTLLVLGALAVALLAAYCHLKWGTLSARAMR